MNIKSNALSDVPYEHKWCEPIHNIRNILTKAELIADIRTFITILIIFYVIIKIR